MIKRTLLLLIQCLSVILLVSCSSQRDWREDPLAYFEDTWVEEFAVEGLVRSGTLVSKNEATRFARDSKWNAISFKSSCTFGDTFVVTTEKYVVNIRRTDTGQFYFYFIPSGGPTIPVRELPLTFSRDSGFRGTGEAVEGGTRIPVNVTIEFPKGKPNHVWTITYGAQDKARLIFRFRFSK